MSSGQMFGAVKLGNSSGEDESCIYNDEFCIKMMIFALKMMNFALKIKSGLTERAPPPLTPACTYSGEHTRQKMDPKQW